MTPEQIASWVAAFAACIQAFGSIAAIIYAVKIARSAEARAAATEKAALAREEAARVASVAREDAVQKEARDRIRLAETRDQDAILEVANSYIAKAQADLKKHIAALEANPAYKQQTIVGNFDNPHIRSLKRMLPELRSKASGGGLLQVFVKLENDIEETIRLSQHTALGPQAIGILTATGLRFRAIQDDLMVAATVLRSRAIEDDLIGARQSGFSH